jgi:hypothetical protein
MVSNRRQAWGGNHEEWTVLAVKISFTAIQIRMSSVSSGDTILNYYFFVPQERRERRGRWYKYNLTPFL